MSKGQNVIYSFKESQRKEILRRAWKHKHSRLMVLHNLFSLRRCTCVKYFYLLRMNFRCTIVPVNKSIAEIISGK